MSNNDFDLDEKSTIKLWNMIYNISLNMLHNVNDAEDATQDIFLKILNKYYSFESRSQVETWAYRIAYNHLIDYKKRRFRDELSFDLFEQDVQNFIPYRGELGLSNEEEKIYVEQVKVGCTLAMLQCLDAESRFVFILGNIFSFTSKHASEICNMKEENYRKKLSRSREKIRNFMNKNCGLVNKDAFCKCRKRLIIARDRGRIKIEKELYQSNNRTIRSYINEMNKIDEESRIFQDNLYFDKKDLFYSRMIKKYKILREQSSIL